ncbi:hypothetical protein POTOM_019885 [Populus tomentosa]|uniref:Ammonium transporter AmtB-like domain-containing protein n=1 Tax=Populus tomentosa TaxID=118781 RepID=A0A8X8D310_POPTO|nr:hypothetical protein POTOM_019885 [Populus tomentosa]
MADFPTNLLPDEASPEWMNKGDNAWQLTAATPVGLQSVPGLVILYGSIVKKKWAVNSAFMALYAFAAVLVCWGYHMSFGNKMLPFLGRPNISLDQKFLLDKAYVGATLVYFQIVFAAITLILVAGALLGRMNFHLWMLFVTLWLTFSYTFTAYSLWCPDGWLAKQGIIDYAGGYVIYLSSGVAGFTAAYWVLGCFGWGWSGFNGGGPFVASTDASLAILNTHVCTATSLLTWLLLDIVFFGKPSVIGATQGMITGVVQGWAAIPMGILSGSIPWYRSLGGILAGFFSNPKLNRIFYMVKDWQHYIGLAYGLQNGRTAAGLKQMGVQLLGILFVVVLNVFVTSAICLLIRLVVPLRLTDEELQTGDDAIHGEEAYALWGDGEKYESKHNSLHGVEEFPQAVSKEVEMA